MPTCPSCNSVALPPTHDSLKCDKCKRFYHWQCTDLDDFIIKQHKKNVYKPWRCPTCVENFCIKCSKKIIPSDLSIACKKCLYKYHPTCSELSDDRLNYYMNHQTEKWECTKCIKNSCRKCNSSIHHKANIRCCACNYAYHYVCWKIPVSYKSNKMFTASWICPICKPKIFPFSTLTDINVFELSNHRLERFSRENINPSNSTEYSDKCSICQIKLRKNNPGVPCSNCKCKIHVKCSGVKDPKRNFHLYQGNWQCSKCISSQYPFSSLDKNNLVDLSFNSNITLTEKKFKPEVKIEDKLKMMLSYSKQSPWYAYTHPDEKREYEIFTEEIDEAVTIKPHFDYYDIDGFKKTKSLWNKKKSLSLLRGVFRPVS